MPCAEKTSTNFFEPRRAQCAILAYDLHHGDVVAEDGRLRLTTEDAAHARPVDQIARERHARLVTNAVEADVGEAEVVIVPKDERAIDEFFVEIASRARTGDCP